MIEIERATTGRDQQASRNVIARRGSGCQTYSRRTEGVEHALAEARKQWGRLKEVGFRQDGESEQSVVGFMDAIKTGNLSEVEPVGTMFVSINTIVDFTPWKHELPKEQK